MGVIELAAGLPNVPNADGQSGRGGRTREVWARDDWKQFERACKIVKRKGDTLLLRCGNDLCPDRAITLQADASAERGAVLRCGCTDRVFLGK